MRRKVKKQNVFIVLSIIFILTCVFIYGGRLIYYYLDNNKIEKSDSLVSTIKMSNVENKNFKVISTNYYFTNEEKNNYVLYSGILWRILKIDSDDRIYLVSDKSITSLAYGENKNFAKSYINLWLNKNENENTGILEKNLNTSLLSNTKVCLDEKNEANNSECKKTNSEILIGLLDIEDYVNTGGNKSFVNTNESFYLTNHTKDLKIWYVDQNGGLSQSDGTTILGVKPVVTLKGNTVASKGTGTKEDPYVLDTSYFGAYVKLGSDIWRVYNVDDDKLYMSLDDYIKVSNKNLEYAYSSTDYKFNDTKKNTLAYYLNNTYLNKLAYKNIIIEDKYSNSYYGADNDYNYTKTLSNKISTKVGMLSIGDVNISNLGNYALMTGANKSGSLIYVNSKTSVVSYDDVKSTLNVVPCIKISKENLKKGTGTKDAPYEME